MTSQFFVDWPSFWARERTDAEWIFEPILAKGRAHAIYAAHKVGKSLLMLNVVARLATGAEPVLVIYLDYEMTEADLLERLADMGVDESTDLSRLRYALLPRLDPLDTLQGARDLLAIVDGEINARPECHPLVVIDTMGRAVHGKENDADTVRDFYRYTGMGLKQRDVTWVRLDHAGKDADKSQRGSSAKGDDVDIVWKAERADDGLILKREVARMNWVPETVTLRREDSPLRFVSVGVLYPAGTKDVAEQLAQLGIAADSGVRAAAKSLRASGVQASNAVITAAQRFRRSTDTSGT